MGDRYSPSWTALCQPGSFVKFGRPLVWFSSWPSVTLCHAGGTAGSR